VAHAFRDHDLRKYRQADNWWTKARERRILAGTDLASTRGHTGDERWTGYVAAASRGGRRSHAIRYNPELRFLGADISTTSVDVAVTNAELDISVLSTSPWTSARACSRCASKSSPWLRR
jgi:hypothetical protein